MGRRASGLLAVAGALVVALAVVTAYALGTAGRSPATATTPPVDAQQRTLTTTGEGTATGIPDEMSFTVAVDRTEPDVSTALAVTSGEMRTVLRSLQALGVRPKDIQTTGLDIGPHYDYSGGTTRITGYTVTQRARVTVKDITRGGKAIGVAARAAGNDVRVSSISLGVAERAQLLARARKAAVHDAMAKARQYAAAGGQRVTTMLSLTEVHTAAPRPQYLRMPMAAVAGSLDAAAVPVRIGRQDLEVQVKVVWSLG